MDIEMFARNVGRTKLKYIIQGIKKHTILCQQNGTEIIKHDEGKYVKGINKSHILDLKRRLGIVYICL
jgi:hypothetical protein